jgi:hypothetical protein
MTYEQACEFLFVKGIVGRSIGDLIDHEPTIGQLEDALTFALQLGCSLEQVAAARTAITSYWRVHHNAADSHVSDEWVRRQRLY